jgi:hypothetical protein
MVDSDNTTTLPIISRRFLLAGTAAAAVVPVIAGARAAPPPSAANLTQLDIAIQRYREVKARQDAVYAIYAEREKCVEPLREGVRNAIAEAKAIKERAEMRYTNALSRDDQRLTAQLDAFPEEMSDLERTVLLAAFMGTQGRREAEEDEEVITAQQRLSEAKGILRREEQRLGIEALSEEVDRLGEEAYELSCEIEVVPVVSLDEFVRKVEFLAAEKDGTCISVVDFLDLMMIHAKDLGINHQPAESTAKLDRDIGFWGPGPATVAQV